MGGFFWEGFLLPTLPENVVDGPVLLDTGPVGVRQVKEEGERLLVEHAHLQHGTVDPAQVVVAAGVAAGGAVDRQPVNNMSSFQVSSSSRRFVGRQDATIGGDGSTWHQRL